MRLFVGIDLPEDVKDSLAEMTSYGISGVKWVNREQFHLSLRFIGEVEHTFFEDISSSLARIRSQSMQLSLQGVGTFPQVKNPRVIWAGVSKDEQLMALQRKVEFQLSQIGLKKEKQKFRPHVTLGRVKGDKVKRIGEFLTYHSHFTTEPFIISEFVLYSSQLTPKGAIYRKESIFHLN